MPRLTAAGHRALRERRRRQILEAAAGIFAERGYAAATIADIARRARVAEGTIYNYFRSKEDLLIHIPRSLAGQVFDRREELPDVRSAAEAERALHVLGRTMVDRVHANLRFLRVFLPALPHLSRHAREEFMRLMPMAVAGTVEAHLRRGQARGVYRPDLDPAIAGRALPGIMFVFVLYQQVLLGRRVTPAAYDEIIRESVRLFLHGALRDDAPIR